jgi:hypothetical protein
MAAGMIHAGALRKGCGPFGSRDNDPRDGEGFTGMGIGETTGPECGLAKPPCARMATGFSNRFRYSLQMPRTARRAAGEAGPRIGSGRAKNTQTGAAGDAWGQAYGGSSSNTAGGSSTGGWGTEESGSSFRSTQHGAWGSASRSQSGQHSEPPHESAEPAGNAAEVIVPSSRQTRTGDAANGIRIPRQTSRNAASVFRIGLCHTVVRSRRQRIFQNSVARRFSFRLPSGVETLRVLLFT